MKKSVLFAVAAVVLAAGIAVAADLPTIGCAIYKFDDTFMTGVRNAIVEDRRGQGQGRHGRQPELPGHPERPGRPVHHQEGQGPRHQPRRPRRRRRHRREGQGRQHPGGVLQPRALPGRHGQVGQGLLRRRQGRAVRHHGGQDRRRLLEGAPRGRPEQGRRHPVRHAQGRARPPGRRAPHQVLNQGGRRTPASRSRSSPKTPACGTASRARRRWPRSSPPTGTRSRSSSPTTTTWPSAPSRPSRPPATSRAASSCRSSASTPPPPRSQALKDGTLLGTVLNDAKNQGEATFDPRLRRWPRASSPRKANVGYEIKDGKYVWVAYKPITKANMAGSAVAPATRRYPGRVTGGNCTGGGPRMTAAPVARTDTPDAPEEWPVADERAILLEMSEHLEEFPGVQALDDVTLQVRPGTVHALMGENGAGKSTLMKCLFGIYRPDAGEIVLDGQAGRSSPSPRQALDHGISMIHQELHPIPYRSVMENIWLGRFPLRRLGPLHVRRSPEDVRGHPGPLRRPGDGHRPRQPRSGTSRSPRSSRWRSPRRSPTTPRSSSWTSRPRP